MGCRIQIAQINPLVGDVAGNTALVQAAAERACAEGADLLLLPELVLTGYPPEDLLLRPELLDRVETALRTLAAESNDLALVIGYPRRIDGRLINACGLLRAGRLELEYAKQHLPNDSVFDEKRYFHPGDQTVLFEHAGLRFGLTICEDVWRPGPVEQAAAAGAQVLLNLNASPFHHGKPGEREALIARHARINALTIVYANLVGGQDELVFDGHSFAAAPDGTVVMRAPGFCEALPGLVLDAAGRPLGGEPLPVSDTGDEAAMIYDALVLGVRDYVRKNGFDGVVLGLSGGIDSALTLAIAVDALGPGQVEAVLLPSRYTAEMSIEDAREQAERLGVSTRLIPIEPAFEVLLELLEPAFAGRPADLTEENLQARCRGLLLMALSNKHGRMLLTTGNKSELAVGYATLYGDMAGGFAPLKDVYKLLVYRLARYRNTRSAVIPERVLTRAPSAELRAGQTDQDSLPPYELLDAILECYIEGEESIADIARRGYPLDEVRRVTRLVDRSEYKRRQAAPGVRITRRAFGRERRYPITSGF